MPEIWFPHMNIQIQELSRTAFTIFGLPVYWYGILIVLGFMAGLSAARYTARHTGQNPEIYSDYILYALIFGIIGARIYYVVFAWDEFRYDLIRIFATREGGLAVYGGVLLQIPVVYFFTKHRKLGFGLFADTCAAPIAIGQAIGRWGNFFNREVFGGYTDSFFAMRYLARDVHPIPESVRATIMNIGGADYIQVQPTFLYESLWNTGLFVLLMWYNKRKKFDGEVFILYLLGYGIGRFWIEGIRTDQLSLFNTGFAVSQVVSLALVIISVAVIVYKRLNVAKP